MRGPYVVEHPAFDQISAARGQLGEGTYTGKRVLYTPVEKFHHRGRSSSLGVVAVQTMLQIFVAPWLGIPTEKEGEIQ